MLYLHIHCKDIVRKHRHETFILKTVYDIGIQICVIKVSFETYDISLRKILLKLRP